jgi:hypothetical protein
MLPKIAEGDANKVWIVPSEIGRALEGLGSTVGSIQGIPTETAGPRNRVDYGAPVSPDVGTSGRDDSSLSSANDAVAEAIASAEEAAPPSARHSTTEPGSAPESQEPPEPPEPPAAPRP